MPIQLISIGPLTTLVRNVVYALPTAQCMLFITTTPVMFEVSGNFAFTDQVINYQPVGGYIETNGGFIRSTLGDVVVTLKRGTSRRAPGPN